MNLVFTIVANNYLPLARSLAWSLKNNNTSPIKFVIFLADEPSISTDLKNEEEIIIPINTIGIENLTDLAFKYNVTEFCTAVKPACFKYVFEKLNAENAIYFDPDIFVFNNLAPIFSQLQTYDIVVTPHYVTPQVVYTGDQLETGTLFVGIYNFGFVAFKNTPNNLIIIDWWENRLSNQCYADKQDALHTDQKWADFLPVYSEKLLISKSIGYNLAPWNLFEREITKTNDTYWVNNKFTNSKEMLIFVHFAGYDSDDLELIHKDFWKMPITKYPDYDLVRTVYNKITSQFNFKQFKQQTYTYSTYTNGIFIHDYHRRLYRALTEDGKVFNEPFSSNGEFYKSLDSNKLISQNKPQKNNSKTYDNFESKLRKINKGLAFIFKIVGSDKYFLLMKLLNRYTRPENQTFLLKEKTHKIY